MRRRARMPSSYASLEDCAPEFRDDWQGMAVDLVVLANALRPGRQVDTDAWVISASGMSELSRQLIVLR